MAEQQGRKPPPTAAASSDAAAASSNEEDDATVARRILALESLTQVFGFDAAVAQQAVEAVGTDVTACYNYILDAGLGSDSGGPVTPIEHCPHVQNHVKISLQELPSRPQATKCSHHTRAEAAAVATGNGSAGVGRPKSELQEDGSCPSGENWLCLECGAIRCSRYVNGHSVVHWEETRETDETGQGHCIAASLADLSVWCYICNAYLRHPSLDPITKKLEKLKFEDEPDRKKARSSDDTDPDTPRRESCSDDDDEEEGSEDSGDVDEKLYQVIAAAAAARGIPLEMIVGFAQEQTSGPLVYPFEGLPTSLEEIASFILSDKCKSVLILAGAGMSVASGIPDFRSADGLYATMNPDLLTATPVEREAIRDDPTVALEQDMFLQNPLPCLELNREFILGTRSQRWKATLAHRFVELLHAKTGKLKRLYTQNIDGLEDQCTQLPRDKVIAVHGSMDRAECARCKSEMDYPMFCDLVRRQIKDLSSQDLSAPSQSTAIECEICGYNAMKPAIVLFRSSLPKKFFDNLPKDVEDVDLLIVIGTSLRVAPANSIVWRVPRTSMRLLVNREEVGDHLGMEFGEDSTRDYFAEGDCDEVLLQLMRHLGWLDDLKPLLSSKNLPETSAKILQEYLEQNGNK